MFRPEVLKFITFSKSYIANHPCIPLWNILYETVYTLSTASAESRGAKKEASLTFPLVDLRHCMSVMLPLWVAYVQYTCTFLWHTSLRGDMYTLNVAHSKPTMPSTVHTPSRYGQFKVLQTTWHFKIYMSKIKTLNFRSDDSRVVYSRFSIGALAGKLDATSPWWL